jgi:hypothetical protein
MEKINMFNEQRATSKLESGLKALPPLLLSKTFFLLTLSSSIAYSGNFNSPAGTTNAASKMYTVNDVYNRLNSGAAGTNPATKTTFAEPGAGPASSSYDLNDVMSKAPVADNVNGATAAEVATGKTFWSLQSGNWGLKTGTAALVTYPTPVAKTKQTDCYDNTSHVVDVGCSSPSPADEYVGQDAYENRGKAWASPRFTDNGDGTVTDNNTGLIWLKDASCAALAGTDANGRGTWLVARSAAAALANGTCGLTDGSSAGDWHLPNIKELQSLIDFQYVSPALSNTAGTAKWTEGNPFSGVVSNWYWSSTTYVNNAISAWIVDLDDGDVVSGGKGGIYYVWPVRGGQ